MLLLLFTSSYKGSFFKKEFLMTCLRKIRMYFLACFLMGSTLVGMYPCRFNDVCLICNDDIVGQTSVPLPCFHWLCSDCFNKLLTKDCQALCPACRMQIPVYRFRKPTKDEKQSFLDAVMDNDTKTVAVFIAKGINVNLGVATNTAENTGSPLLMAVARGHEEMVDLLLKSPRINVNAAVGKGLTPLSVAAWEGHSNIVTLLLNMSSIDVNAIDSDGIGALFGAVLRGHKNIVRQLLHHKGINVNIATITGLTPLHIAVQAGDKEMVELLLNHPEINVKAVEKKELTPFHVAARGGHEEIFELLLSKLSSPPDSVATTKYALKILTYIRKEQEARFKALQATP